MDICRDPHLNKEGADHWACQHCESPLNKGLIERRLIDLCTRREVGYQL